MDDPVAHFHTVFREHYPQVVRRLCRLVGDENVAEDLAQEVFLRLYRNPPSRPDRIAPWLHRVSTRLAYDHLRRTARLRALQEHVRGQAMDHPGYPSNEHLVLMEWEKESVRKILSRLSERDRLALILRHSGYTYAEIAHHLQINPDIVGAVLLRAAKRFKRLYEREEGDFHEGTASVHSV